ncbi:MAG: choice-of-anchor D domain-containing protein [Hydrogenobacter sp.]
MRMFFVFIAMFFTTLSFSFSPQPVIRVFPSSPYDYGPTTIDTTKTTDFAVTNIGDPTAGLLRICTASIPSGFENFKIVADNCSGSSLAYGVSCTISVRFEPHQKLAYSGTLAIVYDDDGDAIPCNTQKTATINLTGKGTAIKISGAGCDPSRFICDFSDVDIGTNAYKTLKVCNASGDPLMLLNPAFNLIENPVGDIPAYGIVTTNCNGASLNFFAGNTDDCVNNYCELTLAFSSQDTKDYFGTVNINDANGGPGNTPSGVGIFLRGHGKIPAADIDFGTVPLGSFIDKFVNVSFTCPNNGNATPGETITLPDSLVSVSGTYFSIGASSCPTSCIENQPVSCNVAVRFQPFTAGVFTGKVIVAPPGGTPIEETLVGRGGPATQNFLSLSSSNIDFGTVPRFSSVGKVVVVRNITSSSLEFNVGVAGSGYFVSIVGCTCNDNYVSNGYVCVPSFTTPPSSTRAYKLRPGEVCSISVGFSPPLTARGTVGGVLIFDTQAQAVTVPMTAQVAVSNPPTTAPSLPSIGSGGGGCSMGVGGSSAFMAWMLIPISILLRRFIRRD